MNWKSFNFPIIAFASFSVCHIRLCFYFIRPDPTLSLASDLAALGKDVFVLYSDKLDSNNDKGNDAMVDHRLLVKYLSDLDAPATVLDIAR